MKEILNRSSFAHWSTVKLFLWNWPNPLWRAVVGQDLGTRSRFLLLHVAKVTDWIFTWTFFLIVGGKRKTCLQIQMVVLQELEDVWASGQFKVFHCYLLFKSSWYHHVLCTANPFMVTLCSHPPRPAIPRLLFSWSPVSAWCVSPVSCHLPSPRQYSLHVFFLLCRVTLFYFTPEFQALPSCWGLSVFLCVCVFVLGLFSSEVGSQVRRFPSAAPTVIWIKMRRAKFTSLTMWKEPRVTETLTFNLNLQVESCLEQDRAEY